MPPRRCSLPALAMLAFSSALCFCTAASELTRNIMNCRLLRASFPGASRGTPVAPGKTAAVCAFFAELSYPFYMSHYPFMKIHNWWVRTHSADYSAGACIAVGVCEYLALALFAWAVMRFWDRPVRRVLTQRAHTP